MYLKFFCAYDDYNWDWTMMQLSVKCLPTKLRVIYAKAPRVVHIGDCGVHTHRCQADNAVHEALCVRLLIFLKINYH
jgi:alpha-1,6-mannosyl-glycoprotein beta-1,2-N-acetylglucosaminyltransferase